MVTKVILLAPDELQALLQTAVETVVRQISFPQKIDPLPEFLTIEQASILLNLKKSTIYTLVSKQSLPHKKICKKLYFSRTDLIGFLEKGDKRQNN